MRIALCGYGRMGREIRAVAEARGHAVSAVFEADRPLESGHSLVGVDALVDFSLAPAVSRTLALAAATGVPVVEGTTGWMDEMQEISAIPRLTMVYSPNFSLGVCLFMRAVERTARELGRVPGYDAYVHEWHHRGKADSPSGTGLRLAELVRDAMHDKTEILSETCHRVIRSGELHLSSTRVGRVPGTHEVGFDSENDSIKLRHEAFGRRGFAVGAVLAAEWIQDRQGIFTMEDFMQGLLGSEDR